MAKKSLTLPPSSQPLRRAVRPILAAGMMLSATTGCFLEVGLPAPEEDGGGNSDAGPNDAGPVVGLPPLDGGPTTFDAGVSVEEDGGPVVGLPPEDAGPETFDAGISPEEDAGEPGDAGPVVGLHPIDDDAGEPFDAG